MYQESKKPQTKNLKTNWNRTDVPSDWSPGQIIKHFTKATPVDVVGIAEALGVRVWEMHSLAENTAGLIFRDPINGGPSGYSIGINASDPYNRKRFTVAHEVAHFLLHRNKITKELKDDRMYRSGLSGQAEEQANRLAADILMPRNLIRELISSGITNPDDMASKLEVSPLAMRIRLGIPVI